MPGFKWVEGLNVFPGWLFSLIGKFSFAISFLLAAILVASCDFTPAPTPVNGLPRPVVTAWYETGPNSLPEPKSYFEGGLFPHPTQMNSFELDTPLQTELDGSKTPYFAFEVYVKTVADLGVEFSWNNNGATTLITEISGTDASPCVEPFKGFMEQASTHFTGVAGPASYSLNTDAFMRNNQPIWWQGGCTMIDSSPVPQGPGLGGPGLDTDIFRGFAMHKAVILVPAAKVSPVTSPFNGLEIRSATLLHATSSATLMHIERSPIYVGVVGDSVAWGQGIQENNKYYMLLLADLESPSVAGRPADNFRLQVKARSGAILKSNNQAPHTIQDAKQAQSHDLDCLMGLPDTRAGAGVEFGEVPAPDPTIPCQIKDISTQNCKVNLPESNPGLDVLTVDCAPNAANGMSIDFNVGRRFDYILMDGCINDIGGANIIFYEPTYEPELQVIPNPNPNPLDPSTWFIQSWDYKNLKKDIHENCVVTNAIGDIWNYLPNAKIAYFGYHVFFSKKTQVNNSCATPVLAMGCAAFAPNPASMPVACGLEGLTATGLRDQGGNRVDQFIRHSNDELQKSVDELEQRAPQHGLGAIFFVPNSPPLDAHTAIFADQSQTWGLDCSPGATNLAVDQVFGARKAACDLTKPDPKKLLSCYYASAFHPDVNGDVTIAGTILSALRMQNLFGQSAADPFKWIPPGQ